MTAAPLAAPLTGRPVQTAGPSPVLDVVVPVHNEERDLRPCVRRLHAHLAANFPYPFRITIVDNASTDATWAIAQDLADELPGVVRPLRLAGKGRGLALHTAWCSSDAEVLAYTDVDLSTDLAALPALVAPLMSGHSHIAIGTRLAHGSRVVRGPRRELISRAYNLLLRGTLDARFTDAQCGFKAIRADVARALLPHVADTGWFFDTELPVLAQRAGLRIHEVPVDWTDDPDSRVELVATALADLRGIVRLGSALLTGAVPVARLRDQRARGRGGGADPPGVPHGMLRQAVRFAAVGLLSTLAYVALYVLLRDHTGAQAANLVALLLTALGNTAANRRLTFGVHGLDGLARHQFQGLLVFGLGLGLTSGALAALHAFGEPARVTELAVLVAANLLATVLRFLLLRRWVFRPTAVAR